MQLDVKAFSFFEAADFKQVQIEPDYQSVNAAIPQGPSCKALLLSTSR